MSLTSVTNCMSVARRQVRALESWRDAESRVSARWKLFLEADPESRPWTFAFYAAALDAEEAAAAALASFTHAKAA